MIIIQNPPCLPALVAAYLVSIINGSTIIVDWHNLGYAMFSQRLGSDHLLVKLAFRLEKVVCRLAHKHICVTEAMKDWLAEHFSIKAVVLYDRPARIFTATSPSLPQRHCLLSNLGYRDDILFPSLTELTAVNVVSNTQIADAAEISTGLRSTCQTAVKNLSSASDTGVEGELILRSNRAKIVVSATSWTEDEDFSMLLEALQKLDLILLASSSVASSAENERVLVVITGKGPLKAAFEACVCDLTARGLLRRVAVKTAWLSSDDYSLLLRCADLGICLHTSSSGLDLPMKVGVGWPCYTFPSSAIPRGTDRSNLFNSDILFCQVLDMFGSGLPVCAVRFPSISELVKHGCNGMIFDTAGGLTELFLSLLFPGIAQGRCLDTKPTGGRSKSRSSSLDECEDSDQDEVDTWSDRSGGAGCSADRRQEQELLIGSTHGVTLLSLKVGTREIGSWDDNWRSVMEPLVSEWVKRRSLV